MRADTSLWPIALLAACLTQAIGCRAAQTVREPEYYEVARRVAQSWADPDPVPEALDPVAPELAGPHPVEEYIAFGLAQNPEIQAARMRVASLANRVPQAASLPDPMLGATVYAEPVQTAAGQQEFSMNASQKFPWFGKLQAQADVAELDAEAARADLAAQELKVIENIKRAYYELYFIQQSLQITEEEQRQLRIIAEIVDVRYRVQREVNQQDLLRVEVELSRVATDLVRLRQQLDSAQARLAQLLHISPETPVRALDRLPPEQIPRDLDLLYRQAVAVRPELQSHLAAIQRDRRAADLARLDYFPDVTLQATWIDTSSAGISPIANGRDAFLLGMSMNLPIYFQRNEANVREAETQAVQTARQYDAFKDQTLQEVKDLYAQAISQEELLRLFREEIIPQSRLALEQSIRAYQVGEVDFLQMIDNWRELLRYEIMEQQLESQLRQTLASLARVIGSYAIPPPPLPPVGAAGAIPPVLESPPPAAIAQPLAPPPRRRS